MSEIHFQIQALDERTRLPISNARLQLQNINLGQEALTDSKGIASFAIKESEYLKPFNAKLIHNNYQESPILDRSIIPNAIKRRDKPFELRFSGKLRCYFNGKELQLCRGNNIVESFSAYSGKALNINEKERLQERKYENFVSYKDKGNNIVYFCLDKKWQQEKDKGAIPEGQYYININKSKNDESSGIRAYRTPFFSQSRSKEKETQWGKYNIPIYTDKECVNVTESQTQRENFFIHGGESYGNNGGIDLAKENNELVNKLELLRSQLIATNPTLKDKPIVLELLVDYTPLCISLDSIGLERIINQNANQHKVILIGNYTKPQEIKEEIFNAQKQQTYWGYREISQIEEFNFDEVEFSSLTLFKENERAYKGESLEINLVKYDWHRYNKQIIVFGFLDTDINMNTNGVMILKNPKWRIITRGFRYDMLKRVFNGIDYALLDTTPTTQAQRNQYNEVSAKVQKLKDMAEELNRLHADNEPMFVHYRLDTTLRLNHFFGQVLVECGNTLKLKENLNYSVESLLRDNRFTQQQASEYGYIRNNGVYIQRANKIQIGNTKYNGRYGNIQNSNDGYNFRGMGLFHLTFRNNYKDFTLRAREWEWIDNTIDFETNPNLLFENGGYAIMSAAYFWIHNNCFANANADTRASVDSVTRIINRYTDSYQERWNQYERIRDDGIFDEDWL